MIRLTAIAALSLVIAGCGSSAQSPVASHAACDGLTNADADVGKIYAEAGNGVARPLVEKDFKARAIQRDYVAGAELLVPAPHGMSREYVERVLSCHASQPGPSAHPNDPLRPDGATARVSVMSSGPGYRVAVRGTDRATGKQIWQRAEALTAGGGSVTVEQVSAAPTSRSSN